jgi:hypothetical protein
MSPNKTVINLLLIGLIVLDLTYTIVGFFFRDFWFAAFHGVPYVDPEGLLPRASAVWLAFTLIQCITLFKWQTQSYWLAITAGLRSAELFTEWTYLYFAHDLTSLGRIGLLISTPANMVVCWFFFRSYLNSNDQDK